MRRISHVYAAVSAQHAENVAITLAELFGRIEETEDYFIDQARALEGLHNLGIEEAGRTGVPRSLLSASRLDDSKRAHELEDFVITNTIPLLRKHEPKFASRVESSHQKRSRRES